MRRFAAFVLIFLFAFQMPASAGSLQPVTLSLSKGVQPILSAIESTWIFAVLTGQRDRFAAMHVPKPIYVAPPPKPRPTMVPLAASMLAPTTRSGVRLNIDLRTMEHRGRNNIDPTAVRTSALRARRVLGMRAQVASLPAASTGINPWWTYQEGAIPGVGKWMLNVANGNLVVQADDIDIPERGIDLAFRRTYNSQSSHDAANSDGSVQGAYGNRWTNTFDAHIAYNAASQIFSVYDVDGARYDYTYNATSQTWVGGPGVHETFIGDGGCGVYWTKKSGTSYHFYLPAPFACSTIGAAYAGRIGSILARNHNNYIMFEYSWANGGDASSSDNLTSIAAIHSDGDGLTLNLTPVNGHPELSSLTRAGGLSIAYTYAATGNQLIRVQRPGNGSQATLPEGYAYYSGTDALSAIAGPRFMIPYLATGAPNDGNETVIGYTGSNVTQIYDYDLVNFTPQDGTNTLLQPNLASGLQEWQSKVFSYAGSSTTMTDTDGHAVQWTFDGQSRIAQTQAWPSSANPLVTGAQWDANNNLIASVDVRGKETDYGYDASGNTVLVQQPQVNTTLGMGRPTARYVYDQFNNLTAYCDPNSQWNSTSCTASLGMTHYAYDTSDGNEPFGKLTDTYTPMGYHRHITYDSNDYGLPVQVQGDPINNDSGRTPTQKIVYDASGNVTCASSFQDPSGTHWARFTYDSLNRQTATADPDDSSLSVAACPNIAGLPGSTIVQRTQYNPDGSIQCTDTPAQYAADGNLVCGPSAVTFTYDADGNTLTEVHHHGMGSATAACSQTNLFCASGTTKKWYDGEDRLVEVQLPNDPGNAYRPSSDLWQFPWTTRYIYDLSQGQQVSINGGGTFYAFGNMYKTQQCLPGNRVTWSTGQTQTSCSFIDVKGGSFDALDRLTARYNPAFGSAPEVATTYDSAGNYGLATQIALANGAAQTTTLSYDALGRIASKSFSDSTPSRSYQFDPDGRETSVSSPGLGALTRVYDADGRVTQMTDPANLRNSGTVNYGYYADGLRSSLSVSGPGLSVANLFQYNYRADGIRSQLTINAGSQGKFLWTYTPGGRVQAFNDPTTGLPYNYIAVGGGSEQLTMQPQATHYDQYGGVASLSDPRGISVNYGDDLEGETTTVQAIAPAVQQTYLYGFSPRNELIYRGVQNPNGLSGSETSSMLGFSCNPVLGSAPSGYHIVGVGSGSTCVFDARTNQLVSKNSSYQYVANSTGTTMGPYTVSHSYQYDGAGRLLVDSLSGTGTRTRTYDAENHVLSDVMQNYDVSDQPSFGSGSTSRSTTYDYDADGSLADVNGSNGSVTLHWDGDEILWQDVQNVASLAQNNGYLVNIESLGYYWIPSTGSGSQPSFYLYDRDPNGAPMDIRSYSPATGVLAASSWSPDGNLAWTPPMCGKQCGPLVSNGGASSLFGSTYYSQGLQSSRVDGYTIGGPPGSPWTTSFQGVRTFDQSIGQWTTADAYAGSVHDPISQKPFTYLNNNPVAYSDPSGFLVTCPERKKGSDTVSNCDDAADANNTVDVRNKPCTDCKARAQAAMLRKIAQQNAKIGFWQGYENASFIGLGGGAAALGARSLLTGAGVSLAARGGALVPLAVAAEKFGETQTVAGYQIAGTSGLVGSTYSMNIWALYATNNPGGLSALVTALQAQALSSGATSLSITGSAIMNSGFFNPAIAARYGFAFSQIGNTIHLTWSP